MAEYRTPLPGLLAGVLEAATNRVLALDDKSARHLQRVEGKLLQLDLDGVGITLFFTFQYGSVQVDLEADEEPSTRIAGTPAALFAMAAPDEISDWGLPGSGVRIEGDAAVARDLGKVFSQLNPDWQAPLTGLLGDVLGVQVASGLRQGTEALRQAAKTSVDLAGRYLNEDSDMLAGREDIEAFNKSVDELRDGVERFEARLEQLESDDAEPG